MSATRELMEKWVVEALDASGGSASLTAVAQSVWVNHESDLRDLGDAFYTWQYDMRWAADRLRRRGVLKSATLTPRGVWSLAQR